MERLEAKALEVVELPLEKIHKNAYNPNVMSERAFEAVRESILEHGFIAPATVRNHPKNKGEYEIVDSEHRYKTLLALQGETPDETWHPSVVRLLELGVMPCVNLGTIPDHQAKRLTVTLNETRGKADTVDLAKLLAGLSDELSPEELRRGLPFGSDEIDEMLKMGAFDWDTFNDEDGERVEGGERAEDAPQTDEATGDGSAGPFREFFVAMPEDAYMVLMDAYKLVEQQLVGDGYKLHSEPKLAVGQVLEALAAEYISGPNDLEPDGG